MLGGKLQGAAPKKISKKTGEKKIDWNGGGHEKPENSSEKYTCFGLGRN